MLIQHKQAGNKGIFFIGQDEEILAQLVYLDHDAETMIIEHTEVDEELKGQNVGFQLVNAAIEHARAHRQKVVPMCPFAKAVIDKKPELQDVLQRGKI